MWATVESDSRQTALLNTPQLNNNSLRPRTERKHWAHVRLALQLKLTNYSQSAFDFSALAPRITRFAKPRPQSGGASLIYVLLVGDPGQTGRIVALLAQACHNVGQLFTLAAATEGNVLTSSGSNTVITERVSSVENFEAGLTTNGIIPGEVFYFGHAAQDNTLTLSLLAPGQGTGTDTNISALNYRQLTNTNLGATATLTLSACNAGVRPLKGGRNSIAQLIANH
jgi:hypothetical protein